MLSRPKNSSEIAAESIKKSKRFSIALAGGSTPKSLYQLLAGEKFNNKIDWSKTYFFFGDERNVLPDDDESNFQNGERKSFQPLNIEEKNIFRWHTELNRQRKRRKITVSKSKTFFISKKINFRVLI